jgi:hypothetical protein
MEFSFGSGTLVGVRTDIANATPAVFGVVQDVQMDFDFTTKPLTGQYQAPVAIGRGELKITGKSKFARIYSQTFQSLFFGNMGAASVGLLAQAVNEVQVVATGEVTATNGATYQQDLGVFYQSSGKQLTRVASAPAQGQYSVGALGVLTFNTGDNGQTVLLNYTYTASSGGTKIQLTNQLMGAAPLFQLNLAESFQAPGQAAAGVLNLQLNACLSNKLALPFKNTDWTIEEFDFMAMQDASGNIGFLSTSE